MCLLSIHAKCSVNFSKPKVLKSVVPFCRRSVRFCLDLKIRPGNYRDLGAYTSRGLKTKLWIIIGLSAWTHDPALTRTGISNGSYMVLRTHSGVRGFNHRVGSTFFALRDIRVQQIRANEHV